MLSQALVRQGEFLFRWRGYLPLLLAPLVIYGFKDFQYYRESHFYDRLLEVVCFAVALTGLAIRFLVMGYAPAETMGRNPEQARVLKTAGMYSLCRNPLYLGNFFIGLGIFLFLESALILLVYVLSFWLYYERIILGEETFLLRKFGGEYARWAERTSLIIPRFAKWRKPDEPFCWRRAVRREYRRFFAIISLMTLFEIAGDFVITGQLKFDWEWRVIFGLGLGAYLAVRFLKHRTALLQVDR